MATRRRFRLANKVITKGEKEKQEKEKQHVQMAKDILEVAYGKAIEEWKRLYLNAQRLQNDLTWLSEDPTAWDVDRYQRRYVAFFFPVTGRKELVPIFSNTGYADLFAMGRNIMNVPKHISIRLCLDVPWVAFPGDESDALPSRSALKIDERHLRCTIRAFTAHGSPCLSETVGECGA